MSRIGIYAWGGPGTIRLLRTKYHNPSIDEGSFLRLYEPGYLAAARQKLGVTDMWVTYSWGFSDATEAEDRRYIVERLPNFRREHIAAHAYVQGFNLVTDEFAGQDPFCRDSRGRLLPYSKDRSQTCPNNPQARDILLRRVEAACREPFDGVFIDNIIAGLPPFFVRRDYASFFGCSCRHCRERFRSQYGYALRPGTKLGEKQIADYLSFRSHSVFEVLSRASELVRSSGKQFGVNLYDPCCHAPELYFGYCLDHLLPLLDYLLIENFALGRAGGPDNTHLTPLIESARKPVFVVSYRDGIGYDAAYTQHDIDAIWSEAADLGYSPCLKATEYVTGSTWHALDLDQISAPTLRPLVRTGCAPDGLRLRASSRYERWIVRLLSTYYAPLVSAALNNPRLARLTDWSRIVVYLLKTCRAASLGGMLHASAAPNPSRGTRT